MSLNFPPDLSPIEHVEYIGRRLWNSVLWGFEGLSTMNVCIVVDT